MIISETAVIIRRSMRARATISFRSTAAQSFNTKPVTAMIPFMTTTTKAIAFCLTALIRPCSVKKFERTLKATRLMM